MKHRRFDVVVIGGGHAGCEAAHAAWRMGCDVGLVTFLRTDLGIMSCNPAIGGLGKGHLVREIDALDGLMGLAADAAAIQYRLLNASKGPAVQGPRVQADRHLYGLAIAEAISQTSIAVVEGEVVDLDLRDEEAVRVVLATGTELISGAVVLTSGTFLGGTVRIGDRVTEGGRASAPSSKRLASVVRELGVRTGRLKTGTPPRLLSRTIDWDRVDRQEGDALPTMMSFLSRGAVNPQVSCGVTHTSADALDVVRENLARSAIYGGHVASLGPRYCPSIEDKVVRFPEKRDHQVFLEPEGLTSDLVYPNGLSTSLPHDVQERFLRAIRGLERVEIVQPGYAIEYDFVDPRCLRRSLQLDAFPSMLLAGQINGTTGYEEAAAQGLMAGLNAALHVSGREPFVMSRSDSYIGVMIDDLVTRGVTEPYRMFTSRAEYRLALRVDNADRRLTPMGLSLGCVGTTRRTAFARKVERVVRAEDVLKATSMTQADQNACGAGVRTDAPTRTAFEVLSIPGVRPHDVFERTGVGPLDTEIGQTLLADALYAPYVVRQEAEVQRMRRDEALRFPRSVDFRNVAGLSAELREKLAAARPESIAQASRIEGMTPAALVLLLSLVRRVSSDAA